MRSVLEAGGHGGWEEFLGHLVTHEESKLSRRHERTGRLLGGEGFLAHLESLVERVVRPQKRGPTGPRKHRREN